MDLKALDRANEVQLGAMNEEIALNYELHRQLVLQAVVPVLEPLHIELSDSSSLSSLSEIKDETFAASPARKPHWEYQSRIHDAGHQAKECSSRTQAQRRDRGERL